MRLENDQSNWSTVVSGNTNATVNTYEDISNLKDTEKGRKLNQEREACRGTHSYPESSSGGGGGGGEKTDIV